MGEPAPAAGGVPDALPAAMPAAKAARSPTAVALAGFAASPTNLGAMAALGLMALLAVYAPFLASETAWWWHDADGWRLPVITELFNRNTYPKRYDLLFNLLALLLPGLAAGWWALRRRLAASRLAFAAGAVVAVAWVLCQVPLVPVNGHAQALWSERPASPCTITAWRAQADGGRPTAWFAPIPHRFDATYAGAVLQPPGTLNPATGAHYLLGTDLPGHDLLAQMLFGARISLTIGFVATGISMVIGVLIGVVSGYFGGLVDLLLSRLVEIMMCFPTLILVLVVMAMLGRDIMYTMVVIGLTGWAGTARLVRGEVLAQSVRDYVLAAEALGLGRTRVMFRHILPNTLAPLLITATFSVAGAVLSESSLSFLGMGDPTTPSWGMLLSEGEENLDKTWLIYVPGMAVFLLLSILNTIGSGLGEALDPKAAK
jgi:peptide/nickel transport system permease protein